MKANSKRREVPVAGDVARPASRRPIARIGLAMLLLATTTGTALAELPRSATIATHAIGSLYNAIGTGIATVVTRHTPMTVRVQPFAGPPAWLPSMNEGLTDMGVLTSADALTSYKGIVLYKRPFKNTRILLVGGAVQLGFYVRKDSPINTVADLKGKRIPTDFPGIPIVGLSSRAGLASAGLSYDDIVKVPVSDLQAGNQAFMEGRTDAGWHAVRSPAVEEANARVGGVRWISVDGSEAGATRMGEVYPGSFPAVAKAGSATGIVEEVTLLNNDVYLVGSNQLGDDAAYAVVKALWDNTKELWSAYPALKSWRQQRMVSAKSVIPYHPGAIKFFKEQGVWNAAMDERQAKLLAQ